MSDVVQKIEAVLFTTGRFMDVEEIAQLCEIGSQGIIKTTLKNMIKKYKDSDSALMFYEDNGKYKLGLKKEYTYLTTKLLDSAELDGPTQQTLAIIAYKQPVIQADIIKVRGSGAYDQIKTLRENEFITADKHGRTRILKLASKFYDYFDVVDDKLQSKMEEVVDNVGPVEEQEKLEDDKESIEEKGN